MTKKFTHKPLLGLAMLVGAFVLTGVMATEVNAQRDPFAKPAWARAREQRPGTPGTGGVKGPSTPENYGPPAIAQRIDYYKVQREHAVANNLPIPKVTSVLTLDELAVTGIFKTPRGYAAMVEATPIKLSYTIYPGDRFFDGQLVAVEENRLVFRKVTKIAKDKFVSSVENKSLRKYTDRDMIQGTAPAGSTEAKSDAPTNAQPFSTGEKKVTTAAVVSPLTEMETQAPKDAAANEKPAAKSKKPVRVASKKKN
jgi:hypothetical protein